MIKGGSIQDSHSAVRATTLRRGRSQPDGADAPISRIQRQGCSEGKDMASPEKRILRDQTKHSNESVLITLIYKSDHSHDIFTNLFFLMESI